MLVDEVKRTGTVTELSVYYTNGGMWKRGRGKGWLRLREERGKVERGANLMKGGTHLELMHSNIFAMKPIQ